MSYVDSLITPRAMSFGQANPEITAALMFVFSGEATLGAAGSMFGLRRVGLPDAECVVPAVSVALGTLASLDTLPDTLSPEMTDTLMITAMRARKIVLASMQRDRETNDATLRTAFDPTDPAFDVIAGSLSSPWQSSSLGDGAMHDATVATRPDAITRTTVQDLFDEAIDLALDLGADTKIVNAIAEPDLGSERAREGDSSIMRAAGLPTSGRALAKSKLALEDTRSIMRAAGITVIAANTVNPQPNRASWDWETRALAMAKIVAPGMPKIEASPCSEVEIITPAAWVAPKRITGEASGPARTSGNLSPAGFVIESRAGVKMPSRRAKRAGQTGPTVPVRLVAPVEIFPQLQSAQDIRDLARRTV